MYVHPFLCGVAVTLLVETVVLIVAAAVLSAKTKKAKHTDL